MQPSMHATNLSNPDCLPCFRDISLSTAVVASNHGFLYRPQGRESEELVNPTTRKNVFLCEKEEHKEGEAAVPTKPRSYKNVPDYRASKNNRPSNRIQLREEEQDPARMIHFQEQVLARMLHFQEQVVILGGVGNSPSQQEEETKVDSLDNEEKNSSSSDHQFHDAQLLVTNKGEPEPTSSISPHASKHTNHMVAVVAAAIRSHQKTTRKFKKKLAKLEGDSRLCSVQESCVLADDMTGAAVFSSSLGMSFLDSGSTKKKRIKKKTKNSGSSRASRSDKPPSSSSTRPLLKKIVQLADKAQTDQKSHQQEILELKHKVDLLQQELERTELELEISKANERRLEQEINDRMKYTVGASQQRQRQRLCPWRSNQPRRNDKTPGFIRSLVLGRCKKLKPEPSYRCADSRQPRRLVASDGSFC